VLRAVPANMTVVGIGRRVEGLSTRHGNTDMDIVVEHTDRRRTDRG